MRFVQQPAHRRPGGLLHLGDEQERRGGHRQDGSNLFAERSGQEGGRLDAAIVGVHVGIGVVADEDVNRSNQPGADVGVEVDLDSDGDGGPHYLADT